jgi:hypothetical protein
MFCTFVSVLSKIRAVPNTVGICSSLISWFLGMLLRYFVNDSEMIPSAPSINGITLFLHSKCAVFLLYSLYILHSKCAVFLLYSLYILHSKCAVFLLYSLYILPSSQLFTWSHFWLLKLQHLLSSIFQTVISSSLLRMVLLVCTCWFNNMAPLLLKLPATIVIPIHTSFRCLVYIIRCRICCLPDCYPKT